MATTGGGDFYANPDTGTIQQQRNRYLADALKLAGWGGPFPTKAAAHAYLNGTTVQKVKSDAGKAAHDTIGAVSGTSQGLAKIGGFLEALTMLSTWASVGWILVGVILILAGAWLWFGKPTGGGGPVNFVPIPI